MAQQILIDDDVLNHLGDMFVRHGIRRATQMTFEHYLIDPARAEAFADVIKRRQQQKWTTHGRPRRAGIQRTLGKEVRHG